MLTNIKMTNVLQLKYRVINCKYVLVVHSVLFTLNKANITTTTTTTTSNDNRKKETSRTQKNNNNLQVIWCYRVFLLNLWSKQLYTKVSTLRAAISSLLLLMYQHYIILYWKPISFTLFAKDDDDDDDLDVQRGQAGKHKKKNVQVDIILCQ